MDLCDEYTAVPFSLSISDSASVIGSAALCFGSATTASDRELRRARSQNRTSRKVSPWPHFACVVVLSVPPRRRLLNSTGVSSTPPALGDAAGLAGRLRRAATGADVVAALLAARTRWRVEPLGNRVAFERAVEAAWVLAAAASAPLRGAAARSGFVLRSINNLVYSDIGARLPRSFLAKKAQRTLRRLTTTRCQGGCETSCSL